MISLNGFSKSYSNKVLFNDVTFTLGSRYRVGLVGRNGHGKTTLLNIVAGLESQDSGDMITPRGYTIGYLTQRIKFTKNSVYEEAVSALPESKKDSPYLAEKILFGLGLDNKYINTHPSELSGGFQVRLNLAKLLINEPKLLLLDEPTNYLDIVSIRWLKSFLNQWQDELILVTHDREFMDSVVTHIAGIHRQKILMIPGTTEKYYTQIAQDEEIYEKTRINDETRKKDMEIYINRFRAKARMAGMVQSRIKQLEKMGNKERLAKIDEFQFSFAYKDITSDTMQQVKGISFGYSADKILFKDISFTLDKGERLCIIGKNGEGKSTLLRVLAGELTPLTGEVMTHPAATHGYFAQTNVKSLNEASTVEEIISAAGAYKLDRTQVRNICASVMFSGDDALKKVSVLSGGERCRVMLGTILTTPSSFLLLDEPTNHLDMDATDTLYEALDAFPGPVVLVTHDEGFLHHLATKLIIFQGNNPFVFEGSYQEFLDKIGWSDEEKKYKNDVNPNNRRELRRLKAELVTEKSKKVTPLAKKIKALEEHLISKENALAELHKLVADATIEQNGLLIVELSERISALEATVNTLFEELNDVTVEHDDLLQHYDKQLADFG